LPINKKGWYSLEEMNKKREAIKGIILDLQRKKNAIEAAQTQQTVKENSKKASNPIGNKMKAPEIAYLNDTSNNDTKHENHSVNNEKSSKECKIEAT
jgi:hypothetical protein